MKIPAIIQRFGAMMKSDDGNVAIEAAIIFPVGFLLIITTLEMAMWFFAWAGMDSAVKDMAYTAAQECLADEKASNDNGATVHCVKVMSSAERETALKKVLAGYIGGLIDPAKLCIRTRGVTPADLPANDLGGSDSIVRYDFQYRWNFFTLMVDKIFKNADIFNATFLVRNGEIQDPTLRKFTWSGSCSGLPALP